MTWVPQPPLGNTREVYMRKDFRFGMDDYLQWPQCTEGYPYMAAIPRRPKTQNDPTAVLWWTPPNTDTAAGFIHLNSNLFQLNQSQLSQFRDLVERARSAVSTCNELHSQ